MGNEKSEIDPAIEEAYETVSRLTESEYPFVARNAEQALAHLDQIRFELGVTERE